MSGMLMVSVGWTGLVGMVDGPEAASEGLNFCDAFMMSRRSWVAVDMNTSCIEKLSCL